MKNSDDSGYTGNHVGVCVLDTGIFPHIDFTGRILAFQDFIGHRIRPYDDNSHGTHVCGIIGGDGRASQGRIRGVAPGCELIVLKVLDRMGNGRKEGVLRAFQWILENRRYYGIRVVNISVGTTCRTFEDHKVLIDGVEASVAQIAQIPAGDIDNVSVLKDAASASIYGVRAANGVILITTKRGMESKPAISYSGSIALQEATVLPDYVGSYDWAKMYNDAQGTDFYTPEMLQKIQDGSDPDHFANTDWARELFHTAAMHQHHLSVSGGGKDTHYMISTSYFNQSGILKETGYERFNFRSNVDAKLGIVKIGLNLAGSKEKTDAPVKNITGDGLMRALTWYTRPTVPVKYSNGHWGCVDGTSISQTVFKNPVEELYQGKKDDYSYHFDGNVFAEVDIWKGLKFRSSLAYKFFMNDVSTFVPKDMRVYDADGNVLNTMGTNSVNDYHYLSTTYTNENILTYNVRIGKHEIAALLGHSVQAWREDLTNAYKENLSTDNLYELDAATANPNATGSAAEYALQSFFGRVNYNYDNRYLFEFNIRRDGSSRMPKANRYANFPSFSAAWVLTNESFMQNVEPLTSFKLRGSWGKLGNQEIGNYSYAPTMAAKYNYYFGNYTNHYAIYFYVNNLYGNISINTDYYADAKGK